MSEPDNPFGFEDGWIQLEADGERYQQRVLIVAEHGAECTIQAITPTHLPGELLHPGVRAPVPIDEVKYEQVPGVRVVGKDPDAT